MYSKEQLEAMAVRREEKIIATTLTEEMAKEKAQELSDRTIHFFELQENKTVIVNQLNDEIKEAKAMQLETARVIRKGFVEEKVDCYLIDNQDAGNMEYYNSEGTLVFTRRLQPAEKQLNIHSISIGK